MPDQFSGLFFIHLPKTGGLTVNNHIYGYLKRGEAYPAEAGAPADHFHDIARLRSVLRQSESRPRFITGHFPFHLIDDFALPHVRATVMREPVERTISQLKMLADVNDDMRDLTPEQIYDTPFYFSLLMDNMQTRLLSAEQTDELKNFTDYVKIDDARLDAAKRNLRRIEILGFQDQLETFISRLTTRFGWNARPITNINVSRQEWDVSASFRQRIADNCRYDCELYAYARQLADDRTKETDLVAGRQGDIDKIAEPGRVKLFPNAQD